MKLTTLLREIESSSGPVTGFELAARLGVAPGEVARMLDALRAAGKLGTEIPSRSRGDSCASRGSCSMTCPGPDECALVIDLSVSGLQIRGYSAVPDGTGRAST